MRKVNTTVGSVDKGSHAQRAGIRKGDRIISINGQNFYDILEYRYLMAEPEIEVEIEKPNGERKIVDIINDYEDIGIDFEEEMIDEAQSCRNKCIFCFIDQLPKGMRETVYFKDDDTRLSFLQGNYVTLTNMSDEEIDRLIAMRISPINISVHTTNPELRVMMLNNRFAGKLYDTMKRFAKNGICMNCQIVACPGINDGDELDRTMNDLAALYPYVNSVSVVPVGLTRYRDGLYPLTMYDKDGARRMIKQVTDKQNEFLKQIGTRLIYLSDEFYLNAGTEFPPAEDYEGFPQIENGVGLMASMSEEFEAAYKYIKPLDEKRSAAVVTGELAYDYIRGLCTRIAERSGADIRVYAVRNDFFGGGVNVSGLVCGCDIIKQLNGMEPVDEMLIPCSMLRADEDVFLDDTTVGQVEEALGVKITSVLNDGYDFIEKIIGRELEF